MFWSFAWPRACLKRWPGFSFATRSGEQVAMWEYPVQVVEIHDADTLKVDIDLGLRIHCVDKIRLAFVNAPELMTFQGMQAKQFVINELADLLEAKIFTTRQEKYGRWLAEFRYRVKREPDVWRDLGSVLLREGHAVRYKHR